MEVPPCPQLQRWPHLASLQRPSLTKTKRQQLATRCASFFKVKPKHQVTISWAIRISCVWTMTHALLNSCLSNNLSIKIMHALPLPLVVWRVWMRHFLMRHFISFSFSYFSFSFFGIISPLPWIKLTILDFVYFRYAVCLAMPRSHVCWCSCGPFLSN